MLFGGDFFTCVSKFSFKEHWGILSSSLECLLVLEVIRPFNKLFQIDFLKYSEFYLFNYLSNWKFSATFKIYLG